MEVEPLLEVLVQKTLEQAVMEDEEEMEMETMADYRTEWLARATRKAEEEREAVRQEQGSRGTLSCFWMSILPQIGNLSIRDFSKESEHFLG